MTLIAIILLVLLGIVLILLEILVVPGITIVGIGGLVVFGIAIWLAFSNLSEMAGYVTLAISVSALVVILVFALRADTWTRISLKTKISSKVEKSDNDKVKIGDNGVTISRLAPMGKVLINGEFFEAESKNLFIDPNIEIKVIKIMNNKLIVKLKT